MMVLKSVAGLWLAIVLTGAGAFAAQMSREDIGRRCADYLSLHYREEPKTSPSVAPEIKRRFLNYWKKVEFASREPEMMHEMYLIYARSESTAARNRLVEAESFDRLKIIERFLPYLNNPDDVDDLVSELYLASHQSLIASHKILQSRRAFYVSQSFRQSEYRTKASVFVWKLLSHASGPEADIAKAFRRTFLFKSPQEGQVSPLEKLMEDLRVDKLAGAPTPQIPDSEIPAEEIEMLAKIVEKRTLTSAIYRVREKFIDEGGSERRWSVMEEAFWQKYNEGQLKAEKTRALAFRAGVSKARITQMAAEVLRDVYQAFSTLTKQAYWRRVSGDFWAGE